MDDILRLIPRSSYPELEKVLKHLLSNVAFEVRRAEQDTCMADMHKRRVAGFKRMCSRLQSLPDSEAIPLIENKFPEFSDLIIAWNLKVCRDQKAKEDRAKRNHQIAILTRKGHTNAEIARRVGVSASTVSRIAAKAIKGEL